MSALDRRPGVRYLPDGRRYDRLMVLDDATNEIYYAQLVEEESTRTVLEAIIGRLWVGVGGARSGKEES